MMEKVKIMNHSKHDSPQYATSGSAGLDLRANMDFPIVIDPSQRKLVPTGIFMQLPLGYEGQVRPRSGLAYKNGVTVLNAPGTIDSDYRGEIRVLLVNFSNTSFTINDGDRIAQLVIAQHAQIEWEEVVDLNDTLRGDGGYGSTGKQ